MEKECKHENEVEEKFKHPISGTEIHVRCAECGLLLGAGTIYLEDITADFG